MGYLMDRTVWVLIFIVVFSLSELATPSFALVRAANSKQVVVPDNYPTIQTAIDHASAGDTVYVKAGVYYEMLVINKTLTLAGEDRASTVINANQSEWSDRDIIDVYANNVTITGFTVENAFGTPEPVSSPSGIVLKSTSNCNVSNNIIAYVFHGGGIVLDGSSNCTIEGNYIKNSSSGISIAGNNNELIIDGSNLIADNIVVGSFGSGISMGSNTVNNKIMDNYFGNCSGSGLSMESCSNNTFVGNTFAYNQFAGIHIDPTPTTTNNTFYHNDFVENIFEKEVLQVDLLGDKNSYNELANYWDNGKEGNYWSDYLTIYPNATETDRTGIGNTPYSLLTNIGRGLAYQDRFPLIQPFSNTTIVLPSPLPTIMPSQSSRNSSSPAGLLQPTEIPIWLVFLVGIIIVAALTSLAYLRRKRKPKSASQPEGSPFC